MKVIQSIDVIYDSQKEFNELLQKKVDETFNNIKDKSWHYISRIKSKESFALKLETGRYSDASNLEDFFGCTLVVENLDQIKTAQKKIRDNFVIVYQRPKSERFTHKDPSSFQFDDLRVYAKIKEPDYLPVTPLSSLLFEIQIKTFLQHAWSIATHDLIYKAEEINWPKERIAFQIKAMLEQAELAISGVNNLINLPEVSKNNTESSELKKILKFYNEHFQKEELPSDIVRLCKNTKEFLRAIQLPVSELRKAFIQESTLGRGKNLKNLSPFLLIVQSVINQHKDIMETFINNTSLDSNKIKNFKLLLPKEVHLGSLNILNETNIVKLT